MSNNTAKRLRQICGGALSVSLAAAGICLMAQCYGIYILGNHPFSREAVAAAFQPIRIPVYLCLGLAILSVALEAALPPREKEKLPRQQVMALNALRKKADLSAFDRKDEVLSIRKKRAARQYLTLGLTAIGGLIFLAYACREGSFHQSQINSSMVKAMVVLASAMAPAFGCGLWASLSAEKWMAKEIELLKSAPKKAAQPAQKRAFPVGYALALLAVALLVYGYFTGGAADVLTKAVNICTECVGLG